MPFGGSAATSFGVLFAAEWGDASQLATAALAARLGQPVAVGIGAWLALVGRGAIAVVAGRLIVRRIPVRRVHQVAGTMFAAFAVVRRCARPSSARQAAGYYGAMARQSVQIVGRLAAWLRISAGEIAP